MRLHPKKFFGLLLASLTVVSGSACSAYEGAEASETSKGHDHEHSDHAAETTTMRLQADGPLSDATLAEVTKNSDLVVVGSVSRQEDQINLVKGPLRYSLFDLKVDRVLRGSLSATDLVQVLMVTALDDGRPVSVEGRPELNDENAVWLLEAVDPAFGSAGQYVLTSNSGVIPTDGELVQLELGGEEPPPALAEAESLQSLEAVSAQIAATE